MKVSFQLTMPNNGSWNGVYTGQSDLKYKIITIRGKDEIERVKKIVEHSASYGYDFEDGWYARVNIEIVDAKEAKRRDKISVGFSYTWMISQILETGRIWKRKEIHHHSETSEKPQVEDYAKPIERKLSVRQRMQLQIDEQQKEIDRLKEALKQ